MTRTPAGFSARHEKLFPSATARVPAGAGSEGTETPDKMRFFYHWSDELNREFVVSSRSIESARQYIRYATDGVATTPPSHVPLVEFEPVYIDSSVLAEEAKNSAKRISEKAILEKKRLEEEDEKLLNIYTDRIAFEFKKYYDTIDDRIARKKMCYAQVVKVTKLEICPKSKRGLLVATAIGKKFIIDDQCDIEMGDKVIIFSPGADVRRLSIVLAPGWTGPSNGKIDRKMIIKRQMSEGLMVHMNWLWKAHGEADCQQVTAFLCRVCSIPKELTSLILDYVVFAEVGEDVSKKMHICDVEPLILQSHAMTSQKWLNSLSQATRRDLLRQGSYLVPYHILCLPVNYTPGVSEHPSPLSEESEEDFGSEESYNSDDDY